MSSMGEPDHRSMEILQSLSEHHERQLCLCSQLEELADSLPNDIDRQECLTISWRIYPVVKEAHRFEEEVIFPALAQLFPSESAISKSIERLKYEHWEDESTAEDISISLRELVKDPVTANTEKISYMLRGFFEGVRRHIAFETDHLLPKLEQLGRIN